MAMEGVVGADRWRSQGGLNETCKPGRHRYTTPLPGTISGQAMDRTRQRAGSEVLQASANITSKVREPSSVLAPTSTLRELRMCAHLGSVDEETESNGSRAASPDMVASITASIETELYRPLVDDPGYDGSAESGRSSNQDSSVVPTTGPRASFRRPLMEELELQPDAEDDFVVELPAVLDIDTEQAFRSHDTTLGTGPPRARASLRAELSRMRNSNNESSVGLSESEAAASTALVPGASGSDRTRETDKRNDRVELWSPHRSKVAAIDGMIDSFGPVPKSSKTAFGSNQTHRDLSQSSPPVDSFSFASMSQRPRPRAWSRSFETTRDGIPIVLREQSGVLVETVEGVDLTTWNRNEENIGVNDRTIPEQEAEEIRDIKLPAYPSSVYHEYLEDSRGRRSSGSDHRGRRSTDSGYGPSPLPRMTRQVSTESWARDQRATRGGVGMRKRTDMPASIAAKIGQAAAGVEEILYGRRPHPNRSDKFRELERQLEL